MNEKTEQKNTSPAKSGQTAAKDATATSQAKATTKPSKKRLKVFAAVLGLGLIAGVGLCVNFMWGKWQERGLILQETDQALLSLNQLTDTLSDQSTGLIADQSQFEKQIEKLEKKIDDLQLRVNTQGRRMAEFGSSTRSDWLLAEAVYLSRLANQRLQTERGVKNPLALLESVDHILQELEGEDLLPVRRALAEDITALRLVKDVDRQGMYLELQALANNIESLPLIDIPAQMAAAKELATAEESKAEESNHADVKSGFFYEIRSLVRVTQRKTPIEPILQPAEAALVKYNLAMMLEQAQIALLREEQGIFETSLAKADDYLSRFFQSNSKVQAVTERLTVLRQMSVQQQLPAITRNLEALETLLVTRQQRLTGTGLDNPNTNDKTIKREKSQ